MKASELIRDAYQEIGKVAAEQSISGDMLDTAIRYLNNLAYSKDYILTGYTTVVDGDTEITTPAYTWLWLVKALAIKLAPQFGQLDSYTLLKSDESEAWSTVLISLQRIPAPQLNGNVPCGSGNRMPGSRDTQYYRESDDGLLTETNQDIIAEDETP